MPNLEEVICHIRLAPAQSDIVSRQTLEGHISQPEPKNRNHTIVIPLLLTGASFFCTDRCHWSCWTKTHR